MFNIFVGEVSEYSYQRPGLSWGFWTMCAAIGTATVVLVVVCLSIVLS